MSPFEKREFIETFNEDALCLSGFDDAIVGIARRYNMKPVVAYDIDKVIKILEDQGMTQEEAVNYFNDEIAWSDAGEGTPIYIVTFKES